VIERVSLRPSSRAVTCAAITAFAAVVLLVGAPANSLAAGTAEATPADWFHIIRIDSTTFAISEPKYWQQNVSYLLVGKRQAILFDTGPGI
jgi:hypothetical protein